MRRFPSLLSSLPSMLLGGILAPRYYFKLTFSNAVAQSSFTGALKPDKGLRRVMADLIRKAPLFVVGLLCAPVHAQSTASVEGQVNDQHGAVVSRVEITVVSRKIGIRRIAVTDSDGRYQVAALPVGSYRVEVRTHGFQTQIIESLTLEVGRRVTQNFQLRVGDVSQVVTCL